MADGTSPNIDPELGFDPDEDLFGFDEIAPVESYAEEDADLDEIFAAFKNDEEAQAPAAPMPERTEPADAPWDLEMDFETPAASTPLPPQPAPAPAPERVQPTPPPVVDEYVPHEPAPRSAPAAPAAAGRMIFPRGGVWILVAVICLNGLLAVVTLNRTADVNDGAMQVRQVTEAYDDLREEALQQAQEIRDLRTPVAPFDAESHPALELAREEIARGEYAQARQRVYSLLSIIDRLDHSVRDDLEARANYLLAEALHLEAVGRMEGRR